MKKIVVTVIGADRVGIVAGVAKQLAEENVNILDISQTIVDGIFDMILMCDMENAAYSLKEIQDHMGKQGEALGVEIRVQHNRQQGERPQRDRNNNPSGNQE